MFCPECGKQIKDGARFCPDCGYGIQQEKQAPGAVEMPAPEQGAPKAATSTGDVKKGPAGGRYNKLIAGIVAFFVLALLFNVLSGNGVEGFLGTGSSQQETASEVSEEDYKKDCKSIDYEELARSPKDHEGEQVKFTGKIVQVEEGGRKNIYRIEVTKGSYLWTDTVYCTLENPDNDNRFLEDDIVTFYGEYTGIETYRTIMGAKVSVPSVDIKYMDLEKD